MGRHTRDAGTLLASLALVASAASTDITLGALSSPLSYVNATGSSGAELVPFSVTANSVPSSDWNNVVYLNNLRSSAWNWGLNVSESGAATDSDSGTTQSVVTLSWPEGDGPEVQNSPWSYCALYIPEMGDTLLQHLNGDCGDNSYSDCEKAVVTYLYGQNILTDPHFTCSGQQTLPIPAQCKTAFGSDAPSQFTMYASNSMTSGSAFVSRTDSSQSLSVGESRPFEVVLFELAKKGSEIFPAAMFINCFVAKTTVDPVLAQGSSSASTSSGSSSTGSSSAENYLTAGSASATGISGSSSGHSSKGSSPEATSSGKPPAAGGLGAASSFSEGVLTKMTVVVGAYVALLVVGVV